MAKRIRITAVIGTRPEGIKMCPLITEMKKTKEIDVRVVLTGQHSEILTSVLEFFNVNADFNLKIMEKNQTLFDITERVMNGINKELIENPADILMVHGDTSSAFSAALAGFYMGVPVCHVEAGLRSYDVKSPYPEEFNRFAIDKMSQIHFCPTELNRDNLIKEGIDPLNIFVTGNTVIDALDYTFPTYRTEKQKRKNKSINSKIYMLMTVHRRESFGEGMISIFKAVKRALEVCENLFVTFPMHPNPFVKKAFYSVFSGNEKNIKVISPLDVFDFHKKLLESDFVLSDSGGIQEEAPAFGVPLILVRDRTERPEGILMGCTILAGTEEERIFKEILSLCNDEDRRRKMSDIENPYGDGTASEKIISAILSSFA